MIYVKNVGKARETTLTGRVFIYGPVTELKK